MSQPPPRNPKADFADFAQIRHSDSAFFFDIGQVVGQEAIEHLATFAMSPLTAKRVLDALQKNVAIYEEKHGHIHDPQLIQRAARVPEAS